MRRAADEGLRVSLAAVWNKPGATHLGVVVLAGDAEMSAPALESVTRNYGDDEWQGGCEPCPG